MRNIYYLRPIIIFLTVFLGMSAIAYSATYYVRLTGNLNWNTNTTWSLTRGGAAVGAGVFPGAADNIIFPATNATTTLTVNIASASCASITFEAQSSNNRSNTIAVNANTLTVSGAISFAANGGNGGTFTQISISTGTLNAGSLSFANTKGRLTFTGAGTLNVTSGDFGEGGTFTKSTGTVNFSGNAAQLAGGYDYNVLSSNNPAGVTLSSNATITTLNIGNNTANSLFDDGGFVVSTATTLNITSGKYRCNVASFPWTNATIGGIVEYAGSVTQTVAAKTYNDLYLSGTGDKNLAVSTTVTVNGMLSMENGSYVLTGSGTLDYGAAGSLRYNTSTARTTAAEWPATFTGTGGVIIANTGIISLNGAKQLGNNTSVALNINSGATLTTSASNYALTFHGDFIKNGTFTAGASPVTISGSVTSQSIAGFTTTGDVTVSKTSGTATLNGDVNASGLVLNNAGTFNLGTARTHSFTGAISGTGTTQLQGGSSTLNLSFVGTVVTAASIGWTAGTSSVNFSGAGNQTVPGYNFYNVSFTNSGIKTAGGAISSTNNLTVANGIMLDMATNTLSVVNVNNQGTIATQNTSATPLTTGKTWGGTVNYNAAPGGQTIVAGTYTNLSSGGTTGINTASGNITVSGVLTVANASTFSFGTTAVTVTLTGTGSNTLSASGSIIDMSGANAAHQLKIAASSIASFGTLNTGTGSSVVFTSTTGGQTIPALSYNILQLNNTSGTNTVAGNILALQLITTAGGTLNLGTSQLLNVLSVTNQGLIRTQNSSSTPIPSGLTWSGSVIFDAASGGQTIAAGTYNNLSSTHTSGTNTAGGALTVNGILTLAGATLDMAANALAGTFSMSGTGTVKTQNSTATPLPAGRTWTYGVEYSRSGNQSVVNGTYSTLVTSGSGTKTMTGNISVTAALTLTAGTLSTSTNTITLQTASISKTTGSLNVGGKVIFNVNATITLPNSFFSVTPVNNLTIDGGATVNLPATPSQQTIQGILDFTSGKLGLGDGATLVIGGTVTNMSATNSIIGRTTGSIQIIGVGAVGSLYFDQSKPDTTNRINNFIINRSNLSGTLSIGNKLRVRGMLTPSAGTVTTNGNLAVASDATGSGRIYPDINPANFQFVGDISIERYVKNKNQRKYLFISSPVHGVSIRNAWQDDIFITGPGSGGKPCGSGTGNGTDTTDRYNSNGFDVTTANVVSIYTYDQNNAARWVAVPNTSTTLVKGKGYRVLYRGERGVNDANCSSYLTQNLPPTPSAATMNVSGTPTTGDVTVAIDGPTTGTFGYTLLGNPYPCELDFSLFRNQNPNKIAATYWTYDPNGTTNSTSYLTVNNGTVVGGYHSGNDPNDYPSPNLIASGQAFFVQADASSTITFSESQKVNLNQAGVFRTANTWNSRIRIHFDAADDSFIDNVVVRFSSDPTVTKSENMEWDAITFNGGTYLSTIKGNRSFAIQTRPLNFFNDTVLVRIVSASTGNFKLRFSDYADFSEAAQIILLDLFTGTQTDVKANPVYPFTITSNSASQGGRFKLVFRSSASVLPVSFLAISATAKPQGVEVKWKLAFEQNIEKYLVQRSDNGHDFYNVGQVLSKGNTNAPVTYTYMDANPLKATGYYRVKTVEAGEGKYSAVVKVNTAQQQSLLSLYPNPVKDKIKLTLLNNELFSTASVTIRNAQGKTVLLLSNVTINGSAVDVSGLATGMYFLSVTNKNGETLMEKFIKY